MKLSNVQFADDTMHASKKLIVSAFALITIFIIIEAPRGQQYFDKIKYNGSLFAFVSSIILITVGILSVLNAYLVRYSQKNQISGRSAVSWMVWGLSGVGFAWLGCDKMLVIHEKMAFALIKMVPSMRNADPSQIDGTILAIYGLCAIPICITLIRSFQNLSSKKYFLAGIIMMILSVGHDVTERKFDFQFSIFDGETFEKLFVIFSGWAFASAILINAIVLGTNILFSMYDSKTDNKMLEAPPQNILEEIED